LGYGLQAVGYHDERDAHVVEMLHHLGFCLRVECRGALGHQHDGGFLGQGGGYLDALPLSDLVLITSPLTVLVR
jgi:hypothetical protein